MADENFEFLTLKDLKNILDESSILLLEEKQYNTLPAIEQIKTLCKLYLNNLDNTSIGLEKKSNNYLLGMRIIFSLRSFLLQEKIYFSIGAQSPEGELSVREFSQDEIFHYITANLQSGYMALSEEIEKYNKDYQDQNISDLWRQVVLASSFDWEKGYDAKRGYTTSRGIFRYVYSKPNPDTNVWVRYYMKQKTRHLTYYYNQSQNDNNLSLIGYNQGWLYEWFQEYIQDKENQLQLQAAFQTNSQAPLAGMMSRAVREAIPGYKGGDYINAMGQQVQAKLGNKRIMTFKTINTVINNIISILDEYEQMLKDGNGKAAQTMSEKFLKLFSDERTMVNKSYNNITSKILEQLKIK